MKRIALLLALAATPCLAQQPNEPTFRALAAAYAVGIVLDAESTQQFERRGYVETWNPALYGTRPSRLRFYSVSFGIAGGELGAAAILQHHRRLKWLGIGVEIFAGWEAANRYQGAAHNWRLK